MKKAGNEPRGAAAPVGVQSLPLIDVSATLRSGATKSEWLRMLASMAMREGLEPDALDLGSISRGAIRIPAGLSAKIEEYAASRGLSFAACFAGLCSAGQRMEIERRSAGAALPAPAIVEPPFTPRSDLQRTYYTRIMDALRKKEVLLAEASTGIGKSRAFLGAAFRLVEAGVKPVVVAAPTLSVLSHLETEWREIDPQGRICARWLCGAREFVNATALRAYIEEAARDPEPDDEPMPLDQAVMQWVQAGAPALNPDSAIARSLGEDAAWLMDDFRSLATDMPVEDFALSGADDEDDGGRMLARLRANARAEGEIIFCTHAMLALSGKTGWALLPEPAVIIVDEAHLLEQTTASIHTQSVSIFRLRSVSRAHCRAHGRKRNPVAEPARRLVALLRSMRTSQDLIRIDAVATAADAKAVLKEVQTIRAAIQQPFFSEMPGRERFASALLSAEKAMKAAVEGKTGTDAAYVQFSPDRRFPSLLAGTADIRPFLGHLWKTAKGGVVLASATLFVPDSYGESRCDYIRAGLGVPVSRACAPEPLVDPMIYRAPEMYLPSPPIAKRLIPPSKAFPNATLESWADEMCGQIKSIATTARGGTLVLLTAYEQVRAISEGLVKRGVEAGRIVRQEPGVGLLSARTAFLSAHREGKRPIMLAVGGAWTGLDLSDSAVPAEDDTLLTDLVIGRLPVGLNRSLAMQIRIDKMGVRPLVFESLLTLKQGLGRLIRRADLQGRRIWMLDGRISTAVSWRDMGDFTASARRMLMSYTRRVLF